MCIGGRVLARRGKGGRRRAPPRPRPSQNQKQVSPFPPKIRQIFLLIPQFCSAAPVQKQYGDIVPSEVVEPKVVEEVESFHRNRQDVAIAAP